MGNNPSVEQALINPIGAIVNAVEDENRRKEQERLAREEQERQIRARILAEAENRNRIERENTIFRATISNKMNELINKLNTFRTRVNELNEIEITNRFNNLINEMTDFNNSVNGSNRENISYLRTKPPEYETSINILIIDIGVRETNFRNIARTTIDSLITIVDGYNAKLMAIDRPLLKSKNDEIKNSLVSLKNQINNINIDLIRSRTNELSDKVRPSEQRKSVSLNNRLRRNNTNRDNDNDVLYGNDIDTAYNDLINARRIANETINGYDKIINNDFYNSLNTELISKYNSLNTELISFNLIKDTNKNPNYLITQSQTLKRNINDLVNEYLDTLIPKLDSENKYLNSLSRNDDLRNSYGEINPLISKIKDTFNNYSTYQLIYDDIVLVNSKLNKYLENVIKRKRLDEINRQKVRIEETLGKLKAIEGLKKSLDFPTFNDSYTNIDKSITDFKKSFDSDYTDVYGLESKRLGIEMNISELKTNLLSLETARARIVEVNSKRTSMLSNDVINKKRLLNDVEIDNLYSGLMEILNGFIRHINTYTATEINNKIDNDIKNVYNNFDTQLNIRFKRLEARNTINEKIDFLKNKRDLLNVDFYVPEKLPELIKLQDDMKDYRDDLINQISISDITERVDFFSLKSVSLIDEIEQEKLRRMNLIGGLQVSYEYKPEVREQIIYKSKLMYYEWISIYNYNSQRGIMEENVISRDGIYGNHYKKTIGEIIVRYSSKVSNDNSPSYLFDKDLSKNSSFGTGDGNLYNQVGDYVGSSRVMIDGSYVNGEFISFRYSQRFKLLRYAFKLGENYGRGVGKWEIYYKDENDIYKELDRNDNRLTLEDYKNTYNNDDIYNKFLVSNNISASEYLIIFTGMMGSDEVGNRGIELKQIYLWTGVESKVRSTNDDNISPPRT